MTKASTVGVKPAKTAKKSGVKKPEMDDTMDILQPVLDATEIEETEDMDVEPGSSDDTTMAPTEADTVKFAKHVDTSAKGPRQMRRVLVPNHRLTPLKSNWLQIISPLVENMKLQVRMNTRRKAVEIRLSEKTEDIGYLQKAADFMRAFMLGFEVQDAIALLRLDDLFIQSFEVKDVKRLQGDHLARCIGRLAGKDGKTKFAIENSTRTRVVIADSKIHILGSFGNIRVARDSICSLILGSQPTKVYNRLRTVSKRVLER